MLLGPTFKGLPEDIQSEEVISESRQSFSYHPINTSLRKLSSGGVIQGAAD